MVLIVPLISNSSSTLSKPLRNVPSALTTNGISGTLMFHSFLSSLAKSKDLTFFSISFIFTLWSTRTAKSTRWQVLFFLLNSTRSALLAWIKWSNCISDSQIILCVSFFQFWFVQIPFGNMVKILSFAQFPVECLSHLHLNTIQSDGKVSVMLELWGMWSTPLLPSLPGPF